MNVEKKTINDRTFFFPFFLARMNFPLFLCERIDWEQQTTWMFECHQWMSMCFFVCMSAVILWHLTWFVTMPALFFPSPSPPNTYNFDKSFRHYLPVLSIFPDLLQFRTLYKMINEVQAIPLLFFFTLVHLYDTHNS